MASYRKDKSNSLAAKEKKKLMHEYDANKSGFRERKSVPSRYQVRGWPGCSKAFREQNITHIFREKQRNACLGILKNEIINHS
jgi:hypothetical protein